MKFKPTNDQRKAIEAKRNTLVSAAAGSGKTAVLVERVLNAFCNEENPLMADRVLIVTFTNAAAAELKQRIEKGLDERLAVNPYSSLLQRQKILLNNAKICTIDSFCINFIRDNFEKADIDPSFKMADSSDIRMLLSASVTKLINDEFNSENKEFLELLDYVGSSYDDSELKSRILNIYSYSLKMPYPVFWIKNVVNAYESFVKGNNDDWFVEGIGLFKEYIIEAKDIINKAISALELNAAAYNAYGETINYLSSCIDFLLSCSEKNDWDAIYNCSLGFKPPALKSLSSKFKDTASEYAKAERTEAVNLIKGAFKLVYADKAFIRNQISEALCHIRKMAELVIKLGEIFSEELKARGLMTFDMAEQTALELLSEYKEGKIVKSKYADDFISQFDEVMVDEYQDTNDLQDTLFNLISDNQKKLFCVGDAKQSIYRFRGANPYNFIRKKKLYKAVEDINISGLRVDLSGNFRSRRGVCDYANRLFGLIMHEEYADIEYDEREKLIPLANFPDSAHLEVEKHFIDMAEVKKSTDLSNLPESDIKAVVEAEVIAERIKECLNAEPFIKDGDILRKAKLSDIVILLRSLGNSEVISDVLKREGIPAVTGVSSVLSTDVVITLLDLLRVINNPFDDLSLLNVLTSPLFVFSIDEISAIRTKQKKGRLISAVTVAATHNKKIAEFQKFLSECRTKNILLKVYELIDFIFETASFLGIASRLEDGGSKKAALLAFRDFAVSFETEGKRSLKEFLAVTDSMLDKDFTVSEEENENAVRIMTIHSSKGLQFPICFLSDTEHKFNFTDCYKPLLLDEKHGFSFKYFDENQKEKNDTLLRIVMSEYEKTKVLAEEVRLLYVALTRAEDKLIITSCTNDLKKKINKYSDMSFFEDGRLRPYVFKKSNSYADWIFFDELANNADKLIGYADGTKDYSDIHTYVELMNEVEMEKYLPDLKMTEILQNNYDKKYRFEELLSIQSKASVTEIVHKADLKRYQFSSRPAFMNNDGLSSAEKGTATHKFMQFCDFEKARSSLKDELSRLYEFGYLSEAEAKAVNLNAVNCFFNSDIFMEISSAKEVVREMNFLTEFSALIIEPDLPEKFKNEKILVQGAVDLLYIQNGEITVVDFKTDRNKNEAELKEAYAEQLWLYGKACEELMKLPVKRRIIYSFSLNSAIEC